MKTPSLRVDIQALRALAVMAVVINHMHAEWLPGGYLGVDIFFVLSGFVITRLLQKQFEDQGKLLLTTFWLQRLARIVPAYVVMLGTVGLLTALIFLPNNFKEFHVSWLSSLGFLSNHFFAEYGDYFSPAVSEQPLLHTWSLAVEMQYYLLFPVLFWMAVRWKAIWLLPMAAVLSAFVAVLLWQQSTDTQALYYTLALRVPEFLVGAVLAAHALPQRVGEAWRKLFVVVGMVVIGASLWFVGANRFEPIAAYALCLGVGLVLWADLQFGVWHSTCRLAVVQWLGGLSYSIYLWHWPLLAWVHYIYADLYWTLGWVVVYMLSTLVLAYVSWRWVENRFRFAWKQASMSTQPPLSWQRRFWARWSLWAIIPAALGPVAFATPLNKTVPDLPIELTRYADPQTICHGYIRNNCVRGAMPAGMLLFGDSHAAMLNHTADHMAAHLGFGVEVISASSCIPLEGFSVDGLRGLQRELCIKQIEALKNKLHLYPTLVLAGKWSMHVNNPGFATALNRFLNKSAQRGQKVLVLSQIPLLDTNPRRLWRLHYWGLGAKTRINQRYLTANQALAELVTKYPHVTILRIDALQFFEDVPFNDQQIVYMDRHHLNQAGAIKLSDDLFFVVQDYVRR